jgi:hypothetical protein
MPNDPVMAMEFAQSKGQARKEGRTGVTFADVAGCDQAVKELQFVVKVCISSVCLVIKWRVEHFSNDKCGVAWPSGHQCAEYETRMLPAWHY